MRQYIIDGDKFNNYDEAYTYIREIISNGKERESLSITEMIKTNITDTQNIKVIWVNHTKSKAELGYKETLRFQKKQLQYIPIHKVPDMIKEINLLSQRIGETLFDKIIGAFKANQIDVILN